MHFREGSQKSFANVQKIIAQSLKNTKEIFPL